MLTMRSESRMPIWYCTEPDIAALIISLGFTVVPD